MGAGLLGQNALASISVTLSSHANTSEMERVSGFALQLTPMQKYIFCECLEVMKSRAFKSRAIGGEAIESGRLERGLDNLSINE